jgi:hypothetical protein
MKKQVDIKLVKIDKKDLKCLKCQGNDFIIIGISWACYNCGLYVFNELKKVGR